MFVRVHMIVNCRQLINENAVRLKYHTEDRVVHRLID